MALIMTKQQQKVESGNSKDVVVDIAKKYVLTERDFDRRDKHVLDFHIFVPEGSKIEDISSPDCWAHIARKISPMSQITVTEKSGRWVALLYVVSSSALSVVTEVIWHKELKSNAGCSSTDEFEVKWINQQDKFGVLRKADNVLVAKGLQTSADAAIVLGNEMQAYRGG